MYICVCKTYTREVKRIMIKEKKKKCCHNYCELKYPADKYRRDEKMDLI